MQILDDAYARLAQALTSLGAVVGNPAIDMGTF
jgi:hypothetical protein